ncbi:MAG TPA: UDP-N-acetylmuramoyl-tripeptide--D-alanyl-D-alanine ligase [Candidatus Deferrimicrobiaceae bacterium]|nr:UDP-N-acetylmuramoyl-tripeptide--D-alanyl-D-alanine ligase [Candidatus Deferrimicrobiaceae bacterium]
MTVEGPPPTPAGAGSHDVGRHALYAEDLRRLAGGRLLRRAEQPIRGAAVDSRVVEPGNLFVALPGERTDGHRYLAAAVAAGAAALVITRPLGAADLDRLGDVTVLAVPDGIVALGAIAAGWRARFDPLVVGVTGSYAKTSTKEAVAAVLGAAYRTLRTEGNLNNEIGLPLTLLRLGPEHRAAVLEMGMYGGGEIADLARLARPRIGVVTAVAGVHLSRIGSLAAIEQAKGELIEALPSNGAAVLNADDRRVRRMADRTAARVLLYGFAGDADVTATEVSSEGFSGMRFRLRLPPARGGRPAEIPIRIPGLGKLAVHNALAAAAVGHAARVPPPAIAQALGQGWSAAHRGQAERVGDVTIIDDAYNASPPSVTAALDMLAGLPGRRVAVLGEMLELGRGSASGHRDVGIAAAATCDLLVVVGQGAAGIAAGARGAGLDTSRVVEVRDREAALDALRARLRDGDVVLVKASRGVELDRLADALRTELAGRGRPRR